MDIELINPFILASFSVMEMLLGAAPTKGALSVRQNGITSEQVNVVCGVTGDARGQVIFGMSLSTADRIASKMIGAPVVTFDSLAASAIAELGNMISGNAMLHLSEGKFVCDITPPAVIRGTNVEISTLAIPSIVIPLNCPEGEIFIAVGLQRNTNGAVVAKAA